MKKILFFIRALSAGGAERQLVVTAKGLAERGHQVTVLTFYHDGFYAQELAGTSITLLSLNKKGRWDMLSFFSHLIKVIRQQSPDVIYSFLSVANIFSVLIRPFISATQVVWSVRASNMNLQNYDRLSSLSYWLECRLSSFAHIIIANSQAGIDFALAHGFPEKKMALIANGIDTQRFYPDRSAGRSLRIDWGVADDEFLIGMVGRIDPMKAHSIFLQAAKLMRQQHGKVRFVCVGTGNPEYLQAMHKQATALGLDNVLLWAGRHTDMLAVYNALNILTLTSAYGEGFPNVIGEAMACGVPCVATDVGDSAVVLGASGLVVPAENSSALCVAWSKLQALDNKGFTRLCQLARERMINNFSVTVLLDKTEEVLTSA